MSRMMRAARSAKLSVILAGLLTGGCSYTGSARDFNPTELDRKRGCLVVRGVPLIRQSGTEECGPAALAMVLEYWGLPYSLESWSREGRADAGPGTRAAALRDTARSLGLCAFLFHGDLADLERELAFGHPVVVGLVKPHVSRGWAHYEVVVARRFEDDTIITLDPARGWRINGTEGFLREWEPSGKLTLVIYRPDPPDPVPGRESP